MNPKNPILGKKYIFLGISLTLTLLVTYTLLNSEQNISMNFAKKEIQGAVYLRSVRAVMEPLAEHKLMVRRILEGDVTEKEKLPALQKQLDEVFVRLVESEKEHSKDIPASVSVRALSMRWRQLKAEALTLASGDSDVAHRQLIAQLRALNTDIGDFSNLILDPELDSYYVMDTVLNKLSETQEQLPRLAQLAIYVAQKATLSDRVERWLLIQLVSSVRGNIASMEFSLNRAFQNNPSGRVRTDLGRPLNDYSVAVEGLCNAIEENLIKGKSEEFTAESVRIFYRRAMAANFTLWDRASATLEQLLRQRLGTLQSKKNVALTIVFFMALLTVISGLLIGRELFQRHRIEKELGAASTENIRLAQAVNAASDGIIITNPDKKENPIIYANESFLNMTGYPLKEVVGRNNRFLEGPETDPETIRQIAWALQERKPINATILHYKKDGTKFWNRLRITPMFSKKGKLEYFLGFQTDVTDRLRAEEEARRSEEAFRYMLLSAPVMIWMAAPDKKFVYVNRFWLEFTGHQADVELGDGWISGVHPDDTAPLSTDLHKAFDDRYEFKTEFRLKHVSGDYRWVVAGGTPRFRDDGSFAGFIGSCVDIHERKKQEAQLLQSQKMETVGTLAGGIAHDLNNQLTPLTGYIDLVMKETPVGDFRRDLLAEAEQAARRCAEVVQRLMNFSRTSNQKKSWLKTHLIIDELKNLLPKFLPKSIETEVRCEDGLWPVLGNDTELQTVLMNLCTNARDAMPSGGKLTITVANKELDAQTARAGYTPGTYVLISVKDTGSGIPPDILPKIFEPFFTTKQKGQGTGLGLPMAFRVVKDHGGWVDVSSRVGQGSVFQVYLPADPKQTATPITQTSQEALPGGHETILFADDEETLRNLGRIFLERLGYKVILAQDGEEAVFAYEKHRGTVDAVVLDMTMPKLSGRQAMKKILALDPKARVLLASGYTSESSAKELIQEGAVDFLAKPYTIQPLAMALRKLVTK